MKRKVLFLATLALVITLTGACATLPPQTRPTDPVSFVGKWVGSWQSMVRTGYGDVKVTIERPTSTRPQHVVFHVSLTNAVVPGFSDEVRLQNGELIVERSTLSMLFRLYGSDRLEATYHNRRNNDRGTWSLAKKKG